MELHRHELLDITDEGRAWAAAHLAPFACGRSDLEPAISLINLDYGGAKIPGIVRREEGEGVEGAIPVGFSSPFRMEGNRLRVASFVLPKDVLQVTSPYRLAQADFQCRTESLNALVDIHNMALDAGLRLGVWGSTGLEIHTGLPYTDGESDLDLLIEADKLDLLKEFYGRATAMGQNRRVRVDLELDLPNGFGVKFSEMMQESKFVLGKSLERVDLLPRVDVLEICEKAGRKKYYA